MIDRQQLLYTGKAKSLYRTEDERYLLVHFRDDVSAFDGEKTAALSNKGRVNNAFSAAILQYLEAAGVRTHFERVVAEDQMLVKHLEMIPVECVVRNYAAGSLCRRLGIESGKKLTPPIFENFLKNDPLHDPMINASHMRTFGWATEEQVRSMEIESLRINAHLQPLFLRADMLLVDYKLEFGMCDGQLVLGDEFTPDGCRIWDVHTHKSLDKDRFRKGEGAVIASYQEAADRLMAVIATTGGD